MRASVIEFRRVLGCCLQCCFYYNMTRPETISSNFWRSDYPYKICLSWIPIHLTTYNNSEKKNICRCCPVKLSVNVLNLKRIVAVFNLSKTDPAARHALKTKVSFKSFGKCLRQIVCVGICLLKNIRSMVYNLHPCSKIQTCSLNIG